MDKAIEQIFKAFNHLAREIQVYLFSGFIIATNIAIIDYFYFNLSILTFVRNNSLEIPVCVLLYIFGQFSMAFYYVIIELSKFDKKINKLLKISYTVNSKVLPKIYKNDPELYVRFIERYIILLMMRWTLSAACSISFIINIILVFIKPIHWQFVLTTIIFGIAAVFFYLISVRTEKDYADRIESLNS